MILKNNSTIDRIFREWGKKQHSVPQSQDMLKARALQGFAPHQPQQKIFVQKPKKFLIVSFASGVFLVMLFFGGSLFLKTSLGPATSSDSADSILAEVGSLSGSQRDESDMLSLRAMEAGLKSPSSIQDFDSSVSNQREELSIVDSDEFGRGMPTISDSREFLKVDYSAHIKTRIIQKLYGRIQTMVRGYGGRIDTTSLNTDNAFVSFVLPKSSFESFRTELQGIVPVRFLSENIGTYNVLPEKQGIEKNQESAREDLLKYEQEKKQLKDTHEIQAARLNQKIKSISTSISTLKAEVPVDSARKEQIEKEITSLNTQYASTMQALSRENLTFDSSLKRIESKISSTDSRISRLWEQDEQLLDRVETVQASISLEQISLLQSIALILRAFPLVALGIIIFLLSVIFYGRKRKFDLP